MSVTAAAPPAAARGSALGRLTVTELKLLARERVRLVVGVGVPLILVIIFGSIPFYNHPAKVFGGLTLLDVYVPILSAFSLAVLSLTVLPMVLADYRAKGVLRRLQTTPAGPARVLAAQVIVDLALAAVAVTVILAVACRRADRHRGTLVSAARDHGAGHDHRHGAADAARSRARAAAHGAGGAGQRGQARPGEQGQADALVHGA